MITDLRKLNHVVEVARAESFTKAAAVLAITQSALTKSVADVESRLGVPLFLRLSRGVETTDAGIEFVARAARILADTRDLMDSIEDYSELRSGRLRIGIAPPGFLPFVSQAIREFIGDYPGVAVSIREGTMAKMVLALETGEVDIMVGAAPLSPRSQARIEMRVETVAEFNYAFVVRPDHPLVAIDNVAARDILAYPLVTPVTEPAVRSMIAQIYVDNGMEPREPQYECDTFSLVRQIVYATDAFSPIVTLGPVPPGTRENFHVFKDIFGMAERSIGIATVRGRESIPAVPVFSEIVRSTFS